MPVGFEEAQQFLPKYLSPKLREELYAEIQKLGSSKPFYTSKYEQEVLQGDGWDGVEVPDGVTGHVTLRRACVISNSCAIGAANERALAPTITVAPIMRLSKFKQAFRDAGQTEEQTDKYIERVMRQDVASVFYLPTGAALPEESLVLLSHLYSYPVDRFLGASSRKKIHTLSQRGFWLFLVKLAVNFCRAQESLDRGASDA